MNLLSALAILPYVLLSLGAPQRNQEAANDNVPAVVSTPAPEGFKILNINISGENCNDESTSFSISPEGNVKVLLDNYYAGYGTEMPRHFNHNQCTITLGARVPRGYSFGLKSIENSGSLRLDGEVFSSQETTYSFQGSDAKATAKTGLQGYIQQTLYTNRDVFETGSTVTSPCGVDFAVLKIQNDLIVNSTVPGFRSGFVYTWEVNVSDFFWKTCE
ncbi:hypothetical protein FA15DRAFT_665323 [Coprinopsis marcescibilis]|uniref:Secreted protein n=1 Tax=Coprinopsis marcescibilis TaxID=230819 RepID=A0A5C3L6E0_COPMA|nr:hypothetical protein FA15DRAFT_665323 [Coprinopsis marcescibilis]